MSWRTTSLIAGLSGAFVAPGVVLVSTYNTKLTLMFAGIAASSLGGILASYAEREYQGVLE